MHQTFDFKLSCCLQDWFDVDAHRFQNFVDKFPIQSFRNIIGIILSTPLFEQYLSRQGYPVAVEAGASQANDDISRLKIVSIDYLSLGKFAYAGYDHVEALSSCHTVDYLCHISYLTCGNNTFRLRCTLHNALHPLPH